MKRYVMNGVMAVLMIVLMPAMVGGFPYLVSEPVRTPETLWDVTSYGMLLSAYDLDGNGLADFYTLRSVMAHYPSLQSFIIVERSNPDKLVLSIEQEVGFYYYIAAENPVLYAADVNEDGMWDLVYKDVAEDGVNGNEVFYDSPSGMFTARIAEF